MEETGPGRLGEGVVSTNASIQSSLAAFDSTKASAQSGLASLGDGESQECAVLRFDGDSPDSDASS